MPCPARAGGAPEWLHQLARQPLPQYSDETNAVELLNEQITVVRDNGEITILHRAAFKILRPEGRTLGNVAVNFDSETRILSMRGWCIPASGKDYEVGESDAFETSLLGTMSGELYSSVRHKVLQIPAADPGNVVGYEYEQRGRPYMLQDFWFAQWPVPTRLARYTLQLPKGWEFNFFWQNRPELKPTLHGDNTWIWELHDLPGIEEEEPSMPEWMALAGRLVVAYFPSRENGRQARITSWKEMGEWYQQLAAGRRDPSAAIRQRVAELTAGQPTTLDKMRALTGFAQRDVRYVAIEIGIGGFQPHSAADVFSNRYGDCKDKATVLSSMLQVLGIDSYYVIVNAFHGVVSPDVPAPSSFNHAILAIRLPQDVPTQKMYAILEHPKLGKLLIFDPTNDMVPLGLMPGYEEGNWGLLVTPDGGELVRLPLLSPELNRLQRTAQLQLGPDGVISGSVEEVRTGPLASNLRRRLLSIPVAERRKVIVDFLSAFLNGLTVQKAEIQDLESYDRPLIVRYDFSAGRYAKVAGNLLLFRPRVMGRKAEDYFGGKERKYPVEFEAPSLQSDTFEITLPPGYQVDDLPPGVSLDAGFATYKSQLELQGNVLRYSRQYEIKQILVPTDKLPDLKKFNSRVAYDENASAVLKRSN